MNYYNTFKIDFLYVCFGGIFQYGERKSGRDRAAAGFEITAGLYKKADISYENIQINQTGSEKAGSETRN